MTECFRSVVKKPLESDISGEIVRYFQVRQRFENRQYVVPVTADFEFLNEAKRRFHGERFERLYKSWDSGALSEQELRREFCQNETRSDSFLRDAIWSANIGHIWPRQSENG